MDQLDVTDVRYLLDLSPYPRVEALRKYLTDTRLSYNSIYWLLEVCCLGECDTAQRRKLARELYEQQRPIRKGLINKTSMGYPIRGETEE